jgi:thiamine biosynthesis lipoprotein
VTESLVHTFSSMGTVVTIHVVGSGATHEQRLECERAIDRAAKWFSHIEARCSRFDPQSELMQLAARAGTPVPASAMVLECVKFALAVADESAGAFDPTLGAAGYLDVHVDTIGKTILLDRPHVLDLGAVAKGLAIDTAARELKPYKNFVIDAGGDLYCAGRNAKGEPWSVGIRHPDKEGELFETLRVSDASVCTSGTYERGGHITDPRTGAPATSVASATVIAPTAMVADALSTAAFVLGPRDGIALLERHHVEGFIVTPSLERIATRARTRAS